MQQALVQHDNKAATVIPILVRPVGHWKDTLFGKLQILPTNEKPVSRWLDEDEAWCSIFEGIREVVKELASSVQPPDPPQQASRDHSSSPSIPQLQMASAQQTAPAVSLPVAQANNRQPFPRRIPRWLIPFLVFLIIVLLLASLPGVQQIVQLT